MLIDLCHVALELGVSSEQSLTLFVAPPVFGSELCDRVWIDDIGKLLAVKISPIEEIIVNVKRLVSTAGCVVALPASFIAQDGVSECDLLKFGVSGMLVLRLRLV